MSTVIVVHEFDRRQAKSDYLREIEHNKFTATQRIEAAVLTITQQPFFNGMTNTK